MNTGQSGPRSRLKPGPKKLVPAPLVCLSSCPGTASKLLCLNYSSDLVFLLLTPSWWPLVASWSEYPPHSFAALPQFSPLSLPYRPPPSLPQLTALGSTSAGTNAPLGDGHSRRAALFGCKLLSNSALSPAASQALFFFSIS